jgi:hypothetical protein
VQASGGLPPVTSFDKDICGRYLTDQACAILNYKRLAEEEGLPTIPNCSFQDLERQLDYVLLATDNDDEAWYSDWEGKKANLEQYETLSFGAPIHWYVIV